MSDQCINENEILTSLYERLANTICRTAYKMYWNLRSSLTSLQNIKPINICAKWLALSGDSDRLQASNIENNIRSVLPYL